MWRKILTHWARGVGIILLWQIGIAITPAVVLASFRGKLGMSTFFIIMLTAWFVIATALKEKVEQQIADARYKDGVLGGDLLERIEARGGFDLILHRTGLCSDVWWRTTDSIFVHWRISTWTYLNGALIVSLGMVVVSLAVWGLDTGGKPVVESPHQP